MISNREVVSFRRLISAINAKDWAAKRFSLFTFHFLLFTFAACSVPNLETPECTAGRQAVKEFYSFHFGNEMKPSKENLQRRERFLSENLKRQLSAPTDAAIDYFTATDDYPKAFRIGECTAENENKAVFQIVFFWKDDVRSLQREIKAETVKENGKWLINRIF
jgi:hypothetical protein